MTRKNLFTFIFCAVLVMFGFSTHITFAAIALNASTPAAVINASVATQTTASFTPPANSVIIVLTLSDNGGTATTNITDNLGTHLTYSNVKNMGNTTNDVYNTLWWAKVTTSTAMTVTANYQATVTAHQLQVLVFTGVNTSNPIGASGGNRGAAGVISDTYVSQVANSWGWLGYNNFLVQTIPTVTSTETVYNSTSSGDIFAVIKQNATTPTAGTSVIMSTLTPTSSSQITHLYFEVVPMVAPTIPGTPTYTGVATSSLTVNWTAATGTTYYILQRSINGTTFAQIATTTLLSFLNTGLATNTTYWYNVAGWNAAATGTFSASSSVITIGTASGFTWTDGGGDNNWNTSSNWAGGVVPTSTNVAIFSSSFTQNCNLGGGVNVGGIQINSGYTGTIALTQNPGESLTVGSSGISQAAGIFTASTGTIVSAGNFSITGGTFNGSSSIIYLNGTSTVIVPASFNANSSTMVIEATTTSIMGSSTFYNLTFVSPGPSMSISSNYIATGTVIKVNNNFSFGGSPALLNGSVFQEPSFYGGEIDIKGDISADYQREISKDSGDTKIVLTGTGTQIIGNTVDSPFYPQFTSNFVINKPSGVVILRNSIIFPMYGTWTNLSGTTINPGTSTVEFTDPFPTNTSTVSMTISGSSTFNNLLFMVISDFTFDSLTVATGSVFTVNGGLVISVGAGGLPLLGSGSFNVAGDIAGNFMGTRNPIYPITYIPAVTVTLNGTSTQMIGDSSGQYEDIALPNLVIDKPSGVAMLGADYGVDVQGNLLIKSGELQLSGSQDTYDPYFEIDGNLTINSGTVFSSYPTVTSSIVFGGSVVNNGTVFFDGSGSNCGTLMPNFVSLVSTSTGQPGVTQIPWTGTGNFIMRYVKATDQGKAGGAAINVLNGTGNAGAADDGTNWTFTNGNVPQFVQATSSSGGAGTTSLTLPFTSLWPRQGDLIVVAVSASNQNITTPTDTAGNIYVLVASSTFSSTPTRALSVYYARNASTTRAFSVTVNGINSAGSPMLSASVLEYTGLTTTSTLDAYQVNGGSGVTALNSNYVSGLYNNEMYFSAMTLSAPTTASAAGTGWVTRSGFTNNTTGQALYIQDTSSTNPTSLQSSWTAVTSTNYAAIIVAFKPPEKSGFSPTGSLDSQTFDTGIVKGTQVNSFIWQGVQPASTVVGFQFAGSNSAAGPWNFLGPDGTANTNFTGTAGVPIPLNFYSHSLTSLSGYRYFRYRVNLSADPTLQFSPSIRQVTLNWSQ
jgi:hypothetical protein